MGDDWALLPYFASKLGLVERLSTEEVRLRFAPELLEVILDELGLRVVERRFELAADVAELSLRLLVLIDLVCTAFSHIRVSHWTPT